MNRKLLLFAIVLGLALLCGRAARASVTVTPANASMLADTSANAASPSWMTLGTITITEASNKKGDISAGTNVTLILNAPTGFQFNTSAAVSVGFTANKDISSASIVVNNSGTLTVTMTVTNTANQDTLTITGVQVQPVQGTPLAATGNIIASASSTESINGITTGTGGTSFGQLSETAGTVTQLAFTTQPAGATAGAAFTTQPVVKSEDQFGNASAVGLTSSLTVTASLTSGTGSLQGTTTENIGTSSGDGTVTFSGLRIDVEGSGDQLTASATGLTSGLSSVFVVSPAAASKLVISVQPSGTAVAGVVFGQQPVVFIEDTYNNIRSNDTLTVTAARSGGSGTLGGTTAVAAVGGVVTYANLSHPLVSTITIQFTSGALTSVTSGNVVVSAGTFSQLQVLVPGQTAAPGTTTGNTGTVSAETAGTAFTVTVNAVDANWNVISTNDTVAITSSDANAVLPANAALVSGTKTFSVTCKTDGSQTVTASDSTDGAITANTSLAMTVGSGAVAKLQLLMPGEVAAPGTTTGKTGTPSTETAGTAYTVTVNAVDANWNVASSGNTVAITSSDANATLPASAALSSGTKTYSLTNKTAGSWTVTATDTSNGSITANTGTATTVNPGAFAKLQILVPGQSAAPGTATGNTGTVSAQTTDNPTTVTVNAVDANWNVVNTNDTVAITTTDPNADPTANNALSNGTQTFSVQFNTVGSRTVTASDVTNAGITANTSSAITVGVGAFAKLQLLMPGETASAGSVTGKTGTPTAQTAGTAFTVTVNAVDANWNVISTNDTVAITSSDASAVLPASAALSSGTKTFSVTFKTEATQTATASDATHSGITANTGTGTVVNPAAASKLVISVQPSGTAVAGVVFGQQPVIFIEDTYNNVRSNDTLTVTAARSGGSGTLGGTTALAAVGGVVAYANLFHPLVSTITIQFTSGALTSATSGNVVVSAGPFSQLQVLVPGQTAAPGTAAGNTGTVSAETAGTAFTVTVNAVDANWNVISTNDTVAITSSDANAVLPANAALVSGTKTFSVTCKTDGSQTVTATDSTDGAITANPSSAMTVGSGAVAKLQLLMPGEVAAPGTTTGKTGTPSTETAGTAYTVTVNAVDANWNVASSGNTVAITSSDANATLPASAALSSGTKTFSVTDKTSGSWTVTATDTSNGSITANTGTAATVAPGAFTKLQILVPGQSAAPGTATGNTGTVSAQTTDNGVTVTVNAVDANWNVVSTNDTVAITSSDSNAGLPPNAALSSGTQTYVVQLNTVGSRTVTASDVTNAGITANTSSAITVGVGAFAKLQILMPGETAAAGTATGKTGTPAAQTAGTALTVTVNAVDANWNVISTNDTVAITSSDASAVLPASAALSSGTKTFSVTFKTEATQTATASDATHSGITANTGTGTVVNPAAASKLVISVQPSGTAVAGVAFAQQPVVFIEDTYNNVRSNDTLTVTAARSGGSGTLGGTTAVAAVGGVVTYANLSHPLVSTITIQFTATGLTSVTSGNVVVSAGPFSQLQVLVPGQTAAPGTTTGNTGTVSAETAGTAFTVTVNAVDANWNVISTNDTVAITSSDANATLPANAALVSGTRTFSVTCKTDGSQTVTGSDSTDGAITANTSSTVTINSATETKLQLLMPGETAAPGTATGKTGTPSTETAGTAYTVTVNAVDANWNVVSTNDTVAITSSDANATLPASAALSGGTKTYSITNKTAGSWTVTATDSTHSSITANTGASTTVAPGAFAKLQILVPGQSAAPGTTTGNTGTVSAQTTDNPTTVTVNAVDANWNVVNTNDTVAITTSDPNADPTANNALSAGTQTFVVQFNTVGSRTVTASDVTNAGITANTSSAITVNAGAFAQLQVLMPGETATAGTATGKTGTPTAQTAGTGLTVTVNAVDANWNVISTNDTVAITSSDVNATLPASAALSSGTKTFSVTFKTVGSSTVTGSDATHSGITANTGTSTTVKVGALAKLQILTPGETASPGSSTGKTGTPGAETAGTAFTVTVNTVDANWNVVSTNDTVAITSSDVNAALPANAALVAGTQTFSVTLKTAASETVTASDVTHSSSVTANTSASIPVTAGAFVKLQLLMPGETAAPGTSTGKTGTPSAETAGTAFNVTVNAVDANWNVASTATDVVGITSSDPNAAMPANVALVSGAKTISVTLTTVGSRTVTASDITDGTKTSYTSPSTTLNAGTFTKLQLLMPGETAVAGTATGKTGTPTAQTAGTSFTVTVNAVDVDWNLVGSSDTISITSSDPNATLPANAAQVNGTKTFGVTCKTAGSQTVTATDQSNGAITANTGTAATVNAGAFAKLQILVPGQTAAPGTSTGNTGTVSAQNTDNGVTVTVNAVDANWNLINTNDTVAITSSDVNATLPANAALSGGTQTYAVQFNTAGSRTVTASDVTHSGITANTSSAITVGVGAFVKLQLLMPGETAAAGTVSGKTGTPTAQTAGTAVTVTVNAVDANWNVVSTNDTVAITSSDVNAALPANTALSAGTKTFSVTFKTVGSWTVTGSDVTHSGITASTGASTTVNVGAFAKLQILVPGQTASPGSSTGNTGTLTAETSGTAFTVTVNAVDANWNLISTNDTMAITSSDANAVLPANAALVAGTKTFNVTLKTAAAETVTASDSTHSGITANTSSSITVNAGPFSQLQVLVPGQTAAPGTTTGNTGTVSAETAGTAFTVTVNAVDANWNVISTNDTVAITSSDANAVLPANAALVSGTRTFSVTCKTDGSQTVTASDITNPGITANTSLAITVSSGAETKLQLLMPGETAAPGTTSGKTGTPNAETAGTAYTVTVNAVDANWNVVSTNDTIAITSSDANAVLPASAALSSGTKTFSVTSKTAGSWTVTATDSTHGTITANTGATTTVNPGAFTKLQILVPGQTTAPGTASGNTGTVSAATEGTAFNVTVNAVDANWNLINTNDTVAITSSDANATLPSNSALSGGTATFSVQLKTAGSRTVTASDVTNAGITANTSSAITVNVGAFAKLQLLMPGETASAGSATGKTGTPTAQTAAVAVTVTVNAVDANWNVVSTNDTVAITSSDANATLPASAALSAGTKTFSITFKTAGSQTATGSDTTHAGITASTGASTTVNPGVEAKLQLLTPGETAAPGTTNGKTGTPNAETAGTAFTVTVNAVDANWNVVSTNDTVGITATDTHAVLPANAALAAGTGTFSVTFKTAAAATVTATDSTHAGITANTSPSITVNVGAFSQLQVLVPGQTAAPGTTTGNTGTVTAQTAGTAFNVTVNAVDANWNVISTNDTAAITSSDGNAVLPASAALVSGTKTFAVTLKTAGSQTVTATDSTNGGISANTSSSITVNAAAFAKLQILTPGEIAAAGTATGKTGTPTAETAGTAFTVTVNGVDANWNIMSTNDTIAITSSDVNATLPASAALATGTKTFSVMNKTAGSWTVTATDSTHSGITANTSASITVNPGAFSKLQLLVPGQTAAPGTASGNAGTPAAQTALASFNVTVNAVDANWNLVNTVTDTAGITSSDNTATLPSNAALVNGTNVFAVTFGSSGTATVTASDITNGAKTANTSPSITVGGASQTITFGSLPSRTYGAAPFGVSATASSGLSVSFSILSGPATVSGSTVTITGAGNVTVQASQAGNNAYSAATPVNQSFNVAKGTPSITWTNPADIVYGTALSGTQLNASSAVSGTFTYTPTAGTILNASNSQTLSVTLTPSDTTDYNNGSASVLINVLQSGSTNAVTASANPVLPGTTVTFTATLSAVAPGSGTPTGNVVFSTNGVTLGTVALSSGAASISTALLSHGSNTVTAAYAGDGNFMGSTNTMTEVVNTPPVTGTFGLGTKENTAASVYILKLLSTVYDADGDTISLTGFDTTSAQGGTISSNNLVLTYTPPTGVTGSDSFNYTVSDTFGGIATGTINVTIDAGTAPARNIIGVGVAEDGNAFITFAGVPGYTYTVQASTDLSNWSGIGSATADTNGIVQFEDTNSQNYPVRYYRTAYP